MKDLNKKECLDLLQNNYVGRIAYTTSGSADIVPITYFYDPEHHAIISYSGIGSKISAMRDHKEVSFQVDEIESLNHWKSVLLHGEYEELSGISAKQQLHRFAEGVKKLIKKKDGHSAKYIEEFSSKVSEDSIPIVYRIKISEVKGKGRN
ncbi:pyridoxamine 5'-phosphate oxidase family protein [Zeaxanthinibacter sp. PT1]|uniref:pyridoxamine 5'-phosphate oxidase family protein n=1 Tax=Zeaxanthinibacter TaxID=561554 RepID=UPI00234A728A|nr:pyridoxamine 5'-phosphate oxidase family protein [Zeaxanthinibacter sp. PT1]MDC6352102.1 pyridoxamine 5'-phosphate oxidase family protein [Zeaxanthinibacter sp. PT1]